MSYLDELLSMQQNNPQTYGGVGLKPGEAYASFYNPYEVSAPQYTTPNPYLVANAGYRTNEFVYSVIAKRARAIAQAPLMVYDNAGEHPEEQPKHDLLKLLRHVNQGIPERMFWQITQTYMDIAGFCAWEVERNRMGEVLHLWVMRPDWCSFMRGQQQPLRAIRYQPYGLPFQDIPMFEEDGVTPHVLFFSNGEDFDPIYPGIRFYSPTMHALGEIEVDNAMTRFLVDFVKHGAKFAGLLSVAQTIDEQTANDYKRRWRESHGGTENWSDPIILGLGTTYTSMQMNFRDMAFPDLDARTETRICNAFNIKTIVADARAGLDVSSYNNVSSAHKDWHYEWVVPQWKDLADVMTQQALPLYGDDPETMFCAFDTSDVYALSEDRTAMVTRAVMAYEKRVARLNEAREEMDLDPLPGPEGEAFYEAMTNRSNEPTDAEGEPLEGQGTGKPGEQPPQKPKQLSAAEEEAKVAEAKHFRTFAKKRMKEGKRADLLQYEWKFNDADEQAALLREFGMVPGAVEVLRGIELALEALPK